MNYSRFQVEAKESVYVALGGARHVKIGVSSDVERRMMALQTGCPHEVSLIKSWPTPRARKIEAMAHRVLGEFRRSGEWFHIPNSQACAVVEALVKEQPRSTKILARPLNPIVFCWKCGHHATMAKMPENLAALRCSKCSCKDQIDAVKFDNRIKIERYPRS